MSAKQIINGSANILKLSPRFLEVIAEVADERVRQKKLLRDGKIFFNCDSPIVDNDRKLRILTEELGEVAEAIDKIERLQAQKIHGGILRIAKANLRAELKQVTAVAVAWLETPGGEPPLAIKKGARV